MFRFLSLIAICVFTTSSAQALMCRSGDAIVSSNFRVEYQACTTSGYCNAYGLNPANNRYEYYYGYHSSCPGRQERRVEDLTCQRSDGSRYTLTDNGWWSGCQIR